MIEDTTLEVERLNQNGTLDQYNDLSPQSRKPAIVRVKELVREKLGGVHVKDLKQKETQPTAFALQNEGWEPWSKESEYIPETWAQLSDDNQEGNVDLSSQTQGMKYGQQHDEGQKLDSSPELQNSYLMGILK